MFLRREMPDDHVALLTLDDEKRRNALSADLVGEIVAAFNELEADDDVHTVVITGAGTVFSAGGDTSALARYASGESSGAERGDIAQVYEGFLPRVPLDAAHDRGRERTGGWCRTQPCARLRRADCRRVGAFRRALPSYRPPSGWRASLVARARGGAAGCARDDAFRSSAAERRGGGAWPRVVGAPRRRGGRRGSHARGPRRERAQVTRDTRQGHPAARAVAARLRQRRPHRARASDLELRPGLVRQEVARCRSSGRSATVHYERGCPQEATWAGSTFPELGSTC